jgi:hypothetical protein
MRIFWRTPIIFCALICCSLSIRASFAQSAPVRSDAPPLPGAAAAPPANSITRSPEPVFQPPRANPAPAAAAAPEISSDPLVPVYLKGLQRGLPAHGYHPGPETGEMDLQTQAAILRYQQDAGLPQDASSAMGLKRTLDSVNFQNPPVLAGQGK